MYALVVGCVVGVGRRTKVWATHTSPSGPRAIPTPISVHFVSSMFALWWAEFCSATCAAASPALL